MGYQKENYQNLYDYQYAERIKEIILINHKIIGKIQNKKKILKITKGERLSLEVIGKKYEKRLQEMKEELPVLGRD